MYTSSGVRTGGKGGASAHQKFLSCRKFGQNLKKVRHRSFVSAFL